MLSGLHDGEISKAIKSDSTLIDYVNCRCEFILDIKDVKKIRLIRQNLRLLGRFLVEAQRSKPGTSIIGILLEWDFDSIVDIANKLPIKEGSTGSTRINVGYQLKSVIERLAENTADMPDGEVKTKLEKKLKYLNRKMDSTWSRKVIVPITFFIH